MTFFPVGSAHRLSYSPAGNMELAVYPPFGNCRMMSSRMAPGSVSCGTSARTWTALRASSTMSRSWLRSTSTKLSSAVPSEPRPLAPSTSTDSQPL